MKQMHFPAPRREWYPTGNGWASREWTDEAKEAYRQDGGWFAGDKSDGKEIPVPSNK